MREASRVLVELDFGEDSLRLTVSDDRIRSPRRLRRTGPRVRQHAGGRGAARRASRRGGARISRGAHERDLRDAHGAPPNGGLGVLPTEVVDGESLRWGSSRRVLCGDGNDCRSRACPDRVDGLRVFGDMVLHIQAGSRRSRVPRSSVRKRMAQQPSVGGRSQRYGLPAQRLGQPELAALEGHPAARLDPADLLVGSVGQRRQLGRIRPGADGIATGRHGQGQALVRAHVVVLVPPGIEGRSARRRGRAAAAAVRGRAPGCRGSARPCPASGGGTDGCG